MVAGHTPSVVRLPAIVALVVSILEELPVVTACETGVVLVPVTVKFGLLLPPVVLLIVIEELFVPAEVGVNVTEKVAGPPDGIEVEDNAVVTANSAELVFPLMLIPSAVTLPLLVIVY